MHNIQPDYFHSSFIQSHFTNIHLSFSFIFLFEYFYEFCDSSFFVICFCVVERMSEWKISPVSFTPSRYGSQQANQAAPMPSSSYSSSTSPAVSLSSKDFPALPSKFVFCVSQALFSLPFFHAWFAVRPRHHRPGESRLQRSRRHGLQQSQHARAHPRLSLLPAQFPSSKGRRLSVRSRCRRSRNLPSSLQHLRWTPGTVFQECLTR